MKSPVGMAYFRRPLLVSGSVIQINCSTLVHGSQGATLHCIGLEVRSSTISAAGMGLFASEVDDGKMGRWVFDDMEYSSSKET